MEDQDLIERHKNLELDINRSITKLIRDFEVETGVNISSLSINGGKIKVVRLSNSFDDPKSFADNNGRHKEIMCVSKIGLDI